MNVKANSNKGFFYYKVAILMGLVAILLVIVLPGFQDDTIRERVTTGLDAVEPARQALVKTCQSRSDAVISRNAQAGYSFFEQMYVADVKVAADCRAGMMGIRVRLQNTGADWDPVVLFLSEQEKIENASGWQCDPPPDGNLCGIRGQRYRGESSVWKGRGHTIFSDPSGRGEVHTVRLLHPEPHQLVARIKGQ